MTIFRCSLLILLATAAQADPVTTPSGQSITLYDVVLEPGIARFRYLAPAIDPAGQGLTHEDVAGDFQWLCETFAIPGLAAAAKTADHVIITLSDREVEFGVATPEATQFIESYTIDGTTCIWDAF
jgi:Family of unknown function (DUF6497)